MSSKNIHELFAEWGKKAKTLPLHTETIKSVALQSLKPGVSPIQRPSRVPRFLLVGTALAALILFIGRDTFFAQPEQRAMHFTGSGGGSGEAFGLDYSDSVQYGRTANQAGLSESSSAVSLGKKVISDFFPKENEVPIVDTREFLKTDYHATVKTRRPKEVSMRITTLIRGYGGRVDTSSVQSRGGYLTFVIPASALGSFKAELETIVPARFIVESIEQENLLMQKRSIEDSAMAVNARLDTLQKDRDVLVKAHTTEVYRLKGKISGLTKQIVALDAELVREPERKEEIIARKSQLQKERGIFDQQLARENRNFEQNLSYADADIANNQSRLTDLGKQDQALLNTVATVRGSIVIDWVSILEYIHIFIGGLVGWVIVGVIFVVALSLRSQKGFELP